MDFNVKSWGWVGDIYHKVESMIQEVDDIMKEKADPVGQNVHDSSKNKKKFSFVEVQAALQRVQEIHSPLTNGKKPDSCFKETNDIDSTAHKLFFQSRNVDGECVPLNTEQSRLADSSADYIGQETREPPVNGIIIECDESEEGHTEATSNCKLTLNCGDEASQIIIRNAEITQSFMDYLDSKTSESEAAIPVMDSDSRHSSTSLGFPSEIGEIDKPTANGMARNLQDEELKGSGSSAPSLVDLMREAFVESPGIHFDSSLSDNNGDTSNVKEAVLESSKCKDELASIVEKDLHEMFPKTGAVDGNNIDEREVVTHSLPASPMQCDESHLHLEIGETCTNVEISSDLVTHAPSVSSVNTSTVAITAKLMEQMEIEALTYDFFEKSTIDGSKLPRSPLSGTAARGINEPVYLVNLLEKDERQFQDSGTSCAYAIDANMETIDLEDKGEELQESCAGVDMRDLFAVSSRVKRFRSIKRKILDAFASRRRTAKEYEQLGILHGDVNFERGGHLVLNNVSFQDSRSSIEPPDDSDWEFL